jgi:class 3 adenylate cyclase
VLERPDEPGRPAIRVSDIDRQQTVEVLRRHCADGRLTLDEFSDRVGLAFEAKTRADLDLVTADLPSTTTVPAVSPANRRSPTRSAVAILSSHRQTGRWRPGESIGAVAIMGSCELDLRNAEIDHAVITINASAIMGSIDVIVPEGTEVELTGFNFMGSKECRVADVPANPGGPVIRVNAFALMGSVMVRNRKAGVKDPAQLETREHERQLRHQEQQQRRDQHHQRHLQQGQRHAQRAQDQAQRRLNQLSEKLGIELPTLPEIADFLTPPPPRPVPPPQAAPPAARDDDDDWRDTLRSHAAPDGTVTILFSDMEGYTEKTERLGDLRAREILYAHNQIIREHVVSCGGFEVKSQGDGFMIAFAGASKALRCAVATQRAFRDYAEKHPEEPIRVRMGLHTGEALKEADDFLGRTVIVASRIADDAKGGQVLVSALLKELTDGTGEFRFGELREARLKGLTQTYRLYPVEWEQDPA